MKKRGRVRVSSTSGDKVSKVLTQGQKEGRQDFVKLAVSLVILVTLVGALYFLAPLVSQEEAVVGLAIRQDACIDAPSGIVGWWNGEYIIQGLSPKFAVDKTLRNNGFLDEVTITEGKVGNAFELTSGDTFDITGNSVLDLNGAQGFTIEMWVKPNLDNTFVTLSKGALTLVSYNLFISDGQITSRVQDTNQQFIIKESSDIVPMNVFSHVALVYNAESKILQTYLNGVADSSGPVGSGEFSSIRINDLPLMIRSDGVILDELSLYNRPLLFEEIQSIFNAGSAGKCTQELECHDGIDNDGDRQVDCQDVDCQGQKVVDVSSRGEYQVTLRSDECEGSTTTIGELV
ncbi:MAG: LamG domain-containing protein [archaeon]|nr:LamG domain-containing protein [archaeon]